MKTLRISVTPGDIDTAIESRDSMEYSASHHCPIATALHRRGYPNATVGHSYVRLDGNVRYPVGLPDRAIAFITRFDIEHATIPQPFTFMLQLPE